LVSLFYDTSGSDITDTEDAEPVRMNRPFFARTLTLTLTITQTSSFKAPPPPPGAFVESDTEDADTTDTEDADTTDTEDADTTDTEDADSSHLGTTPIPMMESSYVEGFWPNP
jgi:hypothetical protein